MADTVLVTGGTGFVAGWVIVELLRQGYVVRTSVRHLGRAGQVRAAVGSQTDLDARLSFVEADLDADAGWDDAVRGCRFVQHIASPLGAEGPEVVDQAVGGTRRLLNAALNAGVKRVVLTSSTAACTPNPPPERPIDERDWTDPDESGLSDYRRSKVLAERAAWDLMAGQATELVTLLPGAIFGPVLSAERLGSVAFIQRLLRGIPPALPRLAFNVTDVRDLAALHVAAMTAPDAAGQRFIVLGEALWYAEMALALKDRLGARASKVPLTNMPDLMFKGLAAVQPQMKALLPLLGRTTVFSTEKARAVLGYAPRPSAQTVADTGESLMALGAV